MTPLAQVATNAAALRNLAARLERMGYTGDSYAEAEHIAMNLLADGYRPLDPPIPPARPGSQPGSQGSRPRRSRRRHRHRPPPTHRSDRMNGTKTYPQVSR